MNNSNTLVAYFSASGTTKQLADRLAKISNADLYEIKPQKSYTREDLDWMNKKSRSSVEMSDHNSRPLLADKDAQIEQYDTIFVGFPIWWYIAPTIINTFLEAYDFSGKKVVLFATSGGSRFGKTVDNLKNSVAPDTVIKEGFVASTRITDEDLKKIVAGL